MIRPTILHERRCTTQQVRSSPSPQVRSANHFSSRNSSTSIFCWTWRAGNSRQTALVDHGCDTNRIPPTSSVELVGKVAHRHVPPPSIPAACAPGTCLRTHRVEGRRSRLHATPWLGYALTRRGRATREAERIEGTKLFPQKNQKSVSCRALPSKNGAQAQAEQALTGLHPGDHKHGLGRVHVSLAA